MILDQEGVTSTHPPSKRQKDLGRGQEPGQETATMTVVVAKRGKGTCPLGGLRGEVEGIPFQNTDVPRTAGVGGDGENSSSSGRVGISVPIHGGDSALFLTSAFGGYGKGAGSRDKKDKSHLWSAHNEAGTLYMTSFEPHNGNDKTGGN